MTDKIILFFIIIIVFITLSTLLLSIITKVKSDFIMFARPGNKCVVDVNDELHEATIVQFVENRKFIKVYLENKKFVSIYELNRVHPLWKFNYKEQRIRWIFSFNAQK